MPNAYAHATKNFETVVDFLRFGMSLALQNNLFYGHGTTNATDDIWALILGSLALPFDVEVILLQGRLTEDEKALLCKQLEKRIVDRIPVPYLTHKAYFCDMEFYVDNRVLIPRSPIAELIRQHFSPWINELHVNRVLDLCTGSACIAIATCFAFPEALVDAIDISRDALEVAEINRQHYEVADRLTLIESDCFNNVSHAKYDIIVSNPPYVGHDEMLGLPKEYSHEPTLALETEANGLSIVLRILHQAANYLTPHGILVVEVGNSEFELINAYPDVPFTWLDFEHGGQGVFLLTYHQLIQYFAE